MDLARVRVREAGDALMRAIGRPTWDALPDSIKNRHITGLLAFDPSGWFGPSTVEQYLRGDATGVP